MVDNQQLVNQTQSDNEYQTLLAQQLRDRIEQERSQSKMIPPNKRVWGNVEYYHLADDSWFMARRALLLVMGIIGMLVFIRGRKDYLFPDSANYGYVAIALPYGLIVGFLSYAPETITPITGLLVMGLCTALAEHVFFFGFLGRSLLIQMESRLSSILLLLLLFALYQSTFFATTTDTLAHSALGVLQATLFVGAACAWLMYRSHSILNSFILHLSVQLVLMLKFAGIL